jgi:hypothetical protein
LLSLLPAAAVTSTVPGLFAAGTVTVQRVVDWHSTSVAVFLCDAGVAEAAGQECCDLALAGGDAINL